MSVLVKDRKESVVQFVDTARNLVKFTTQKGLKLPKRLTFVITTDIIKVSQEVYRNTLLIKRLYAKFDERIDLCQKTIADLEYMASMLDVVKIYAPNTPSKDFERWLNMIEQEINLLNGVIKKDREKLKEENK